MLRVDYYHRFVEGFPCIAAPVLVFPMNLGPCKVFCDASCIGFGAVLVQGCRLIAYMSRQLKPYEGTIWSMIWSLAFITAEGKYLTMKVLTLVHKIVRLRISCHSGVRVCVVARLSCLSASELVSVMIYICMSLWTWCAGWC